MIMQQKFTAEMTTETLQTAEVELTEKADWAAASYIERSLKAGISAASSEKPKAAQSLERNEKKQLEFSNEQSKGNSLGMDRGDAAEWPAVARKPAAMSQAAFPTAKAEVKAGKRNKGEARLAQTKASAAEPAAKVKTERAASKPVWAACLMRLLSPSASKCRICARTQPLLGSPGCRTSGQQMV